MNRHITKPGTGKLIAGIIMLICGFSGIGYIPGKPQMVTIICVVLMLTGITMLLLYREDLRLYAEALEAEDRYRSKAAGSRHRRMKAEDQIQAEVQA